MSGSEYDSEEPSSKRGNGKDASGAEMVRCRGCLEVRSTRKNLIRHCKNKHRSFYRANKKKPRSFFEALPGQRTPDDPRGLSPKGTCTSRAGAPVEPPVVKRAKVEPTVEEPAAEMDDFKNRLDAELADDDPVMLTDECCLYDHLMELVPHFESASALAYFRSPQAREASSTPRNLINCGRGWVMELTEVDLARVLFAAIALGGSTLALYRDCLGNVEAKKQEAVQKKLRELLHERVYGLGFDDVFAKWLASSLQRLNELSVRLLESLDPGSYPLIRLSTVSQFNYDTQLRIFKSRAAVMFQGFRDDKRNVLEAAITLTSDRHITLNMDQLGKVILSVRDLPRRSKEELGRFRALTIDVWDAESQRGK